MIRIIRTALAFVIAGSASYAGSLAYVAPEATAIEGAGMMGGTSTWLIPLVIVSILALSLSNSNGSTKD